MTVDLSPVVNAALGLGGLGLSAFGMWALRMVAQRMGVQIDAGQQQALNIALVKAISFGATTAESMAAAKGWTSPDVKSTVAAAALQFLSDHASGALKQAGLDPVADQATIAAHIEALLPTAMMGVVSSPLTTNGPGAAARPIPPPPLAPAPPAPAPVPPPAPAPVGDPAMIRPTVELDQRSPLVPSKPASDA